MASRPNTVRASCVSDSTLYYVYKSSNPSSSLSKHPNMSHPPALPQWTAQHQTGTLLSALAGRQRSRGATRPQITPVNIHSLFFTTQLTLPGCLCMCSSHGCEKRRPFCRRSRPHACQQAADGDRTRSQPSSAAVSHSAAIKVCDIPRLSCTEAALCQI